MAITVAFSEDPAWVLSEAGSFLASEPVLHNVILTLLHERVAHHDPGRYWLAKDGGTVVGVVFQSPLNFAATLTPMEPEAVAVMVNAISDAGVALPGVNGEAATAARFAGRWTERHKMAAVPFEGQRIYETLEVQERAAVSGRLRKAVPGDRALVVAWMRRFQADIGERVSDLEPTVDCPQDGSGYGMTASPCRWRRTRRRWKASSACRPRTRHRRGGTAATPGRALAPSRNISSTAGTAASSTPTRAIRSPTSSSAGSAIAPSLKLFAIASSEGGYGHPLGNPSSEPSSHTRKPISRNHRRTVLCADEEVLDK